MRTLLLLALAALLVPGAAAAQETRGGKPAQRVTSIRTIVTGDLRKLVVTKTGITRIVVGRTGCRIPPKLKARAGRFVIGAPVRIECRNGLLRSIRHAPSHAGSRVSKTAAAAVVTTSQAGAGNSSGGCTKHTKVDENGAEQVVSITCTQRSN